jgi:uncharacterized membrane protein
MTRLLAVAALAAFVATEAAAQATFYIVQDTTTKRCTVVRERPTVKTTVVVSPTGAVYKTEEEATTAMRTIKVCETR